MPLLTDSNDLKKRILEESKGYVVLPPQEGEFTIQDFIDAYDEEISLYKAKLALDEMEKDGKVCKRDGGSGRKVIYSWKEEI